MLDGKSRLWPKLQCLSCYRRDRELLFYSVHGDLLRMDIDSGKTELVGKIPEPGKTSTSVYSIFIINSQVYRLNNDDNRLLDEYNREVISLKEIGNPVPFLYYSRQIENQINILFGDGSLFREIDVNNHTYIYERIDDLCEFIAETENEIFYWNKEGELICLTRKNEKKQLDLLDLRIEDRIRSVAKNEGRYYFMKEDGEISAASIDESGKKVLICKGDGLKYQNLHFAGDKLIQIPYSMKNKIRIVYRDDDLFKYRYEEYPEDIISYDSQKFKFVRSMQDNEYIFYPMRGMNYFLIIDRRCGEIKWIMPNCTKDTMKQIVESYFTDNKVIDEGELRLEDFVERIISE